MGKELRNELKRLFKKNPTWRTPHFMIKDIDLYMSLIDDKDEYPLTKIETYSEIRQMSLNAEDLIADRIINEHVDFDEARKYVKEKTGLPILVKIRRWGWREPDVLELDEDQEKRLAHAISSELFAKRRTKRIKTVMIPSEMYKR